MMYGEDGWMQYYEGYISPSLFFPHVFSLNHVHACETNILLIIIILFNSKYSSYISYFNIITEKMCSLPSF